MYETIKLWLAVGGNCTDSTVVDQTIAHMLADANADKLEDSRVGKNIVNSLCCHIQMFALYRKATIHLTHCHLQERYICIESDMNSHLHIFVYWQKRKGKRSENALTTSFGKEPIKLILLFMKNLKKACQ